MGVRGGKNIFFAAARLKSKFECIFSENAAVVLSLCAAALVKRLKGVEVSQHSERERELQATTFLHSALQDVMSVA